jgi:hypothetical protein
MRNNIFSVAAACLAVGVAGAGAAAAVDPAHVGVVSAVDGPEGSVLVLKGSETRVLNAGDVLFENDQVFTRSSGKATLAFEGCTLDLSSASSVIVNDQVCSAAYVGVLQDPAGGAGGAAGGAAAGGDDDDDDHAAGAIIAGVALVAVVATIASDDDPSSP